MFSGNMNNGKYAFIVAKISHILMLMVKKFTKQCTKYVDYKKKNNVQRQVAVMMELTAGFGGFLMHVCVSCGRERKS